MKYTKIIFIVITILVGMFFLSDKLSTPNELANASSNDSTILHDRASYLDYSEVNLSNAKRHGDILLFFAATTWCSNCVELEKQIKTHINELPKDITILKVDYDNDTKTKAKYLVAQQTTLVLLNNNEDEIKRWIGTGSFDDLMENIN